MAELDERALGARIREARERAALKQGELGALVGLERTAVNKIEGGVRKVTALELSDIASVLGVRMSSFLADPVPALVSHRSSQGLDTADSKIDRLLASIAADVEFVHSLAAEELGLPADEGETLQRPSTLADADHLALQVRDLLGMDARSPLHDLVDRTASIGLLTFSRDLGVDTADAGTILLRHGAVSLVNSRNKVGRRRLALAHELGHYLVADEYTIDWRVTDLPSGGDIESRLDRFARALLLPEPGLTAAWDQHRARDLRETAVVLASEFRVDMATLARRLEELSLVDRDGAFLIRGTTTTRADIVDLGLFVPMDLEGTSLPLPYQKAVLRAFRDEQISQERALELLHDTFAEDDLPSLRPRREDEIWNFVS
ncbi:MAG TPA: XRE family transcriptional regulator [Nocardioides sp.]|uniref:helix-turn-helix domain-containing protein n=1 Tax=uncultured Nocardioides sp. TaxID=198441 RepID=UPI000ED09DA7|nr:XRE family transcriptional regulator [uncultured Nocardioides sp.]HCB07131.1 Cro/Cl family transcriptional regulator [Nocardioides sp.]HRD59323.1 XRE family transcriptional regulator [Nocardioides sp.]HRI95454.1 XRE family transcriptional regulator [Nocardioides sp.]HRK44664.1 XRE family transcriptional regulator [Nocardioides sp.]